MNSFHADRLLRSRGPEPKLGMKWHKFLIYASLWLSAANGFLNAVTYYNGTVYGADAAEVYVYYTGLSTLDKGMAIFCLALGFYSVVTRFALAKFKTNAPKLLLALFAINFALNVLYLLLFSIITAIPLTGLLDASTLTTLLSNLALLIFNKSYYDARASLFIN